MNGVGCYSRTSLASVLAPVMFLEQEAQISQSKFDKKTIEYTREHIKEIKDVIRNCLRNKNMKGMNESDVEDIFMEIIEYQTEHDDYCANKAYNREENNMVPIGGYVARIAQLCTLRYITKYCNHNKRMVSKDNIKELHDEIPDDSALIQFQRVEDNDAKSFLKDMETIRYKYDSDIDIYQFIYIKIICKDWDASKIDSFISFFNITRIELNEISRRIEHDEAVNDLKRAMALNIVETISLLKGYIYGVQFIDEIADTFR